MPGASGTPKLSIVVLNYNYGRFLPECMRSILDQTFTDFEVIIIDDCSKDDSVAIAQQFLSDQRVRLVSHEKNAGFTKSLIEGTEELSRGDLLTVISADDFVLRKDAFELQVALLDRHPTAAYCFSAFDFLRPDGSSTHNSFPEECALGPAEALRSLIVCQGVWPLHSGMIIRKQAYEKCGGYRRDVSMPLDLALFFDLAIVGGFAYTPHSLYGYRLHGTQMTTSKTRKNVREIAQLVREACDAGEARGFGTAALARRAVGDHLGAFAVYEAFAGNPRVALDRWLAAAIECPVETLVSRRLWSAAARAALGTTGFSVGRKLFRFPGKVVRQFSTDSVES